MKELTIEYKAKAYDEAYKEVAVRFGSNVADEIFLKESEDEKIRKELLTWLKSKDGQTLPMDRYNAAITWLEKQGNKDEEILTLKDQIESLHVAIKALKEAHKIEIEKQGESYTKRDIDDTYLKGISDAKNEFEKQYEANYQIRKDIATFIFNYKGDIKDRAKWMDYLGIKVSFTEKQGEQKPTDKVEPKFHEGDWVVYCNEDVDLITGIEENGYCINNGGYIPFICASDIRLWTIEDAKDGDVLKEDSCIFIIEKMNPCGTAIVHCCLFDDGEFDLTDSTLGFDVDSTYPATKEQRDLLFQKMKEAGYEWDAKKKELKEIEQNPVIEMKTPEESLGVDSDTYNKIVDECIYGEQNHAWSEEDETVLGNLIYALANDRIGNDRDEYVDWLKSLRPQNAWKPSDEQMDAINDAIDYLGGNTKIVRKHLMSLYEQLKKLKA